jgi:hypothetical protein
MKKHNYSWSDGVLFSCVLKLNLKHLIPMLSSNSKSLDFEHNAFIIIINKNTKTINKVIIISNTTPLNY